MYRVQHIRDAMSSANPSRPISLSLSIFVDTLFGASNNGAWCRIQDRNKEKHVPRATTLKLLGQRLRGEIHHREMHVAGQFFRRAKILPNIILWQSSPKQNFQTKPTKPWFAPAINILGFCLCSSATSEPEASIRSSPKSCFRFQDASLGPHDNSA